MLTIFGILMVVVMLACILLIFIVLLQNPKGGGLSSSFGGSGTQMFGVQKTNDFMDKATWAIGGTIATLCILASVLVAKPAVYKTMPKQATEQQVPATTPQQAPVNPTNAPAK